MQGLVEGSVLQPYAVTVTWSDNGRGLYIDDVCSCPIGGGCKHAVALILTARSPEPPTEPIEPRLPPRLRVVPPSVAVPDWRRALDGIVGAVEPAGSRATGLPMA